MMMTMPSMAMPDLAVASGYWRSYLTTVDVEYSDLKLAVPVVAIVPDILPILPSKEDVVVKEGRSDAPNRKFMPPFGDDAVAVYKHRQRHRVTRLAQQLGAAVTQNKRTRRFARHRIAHPSPSFTATFDPQAARCRCRSFFDILPSLITVSRG
jgi:hypothetical protein